MPSLSTPELNPPPSPPSNRSRIPKRKPSLSLQPNIRGPAHPPSPRTPTTASRSAADWTTTIKKETRGSIRGVSMPMPVRSSREPGGASALETRRSDSPSASSKDFIKPDLPSSTFPTPHHLTISTSTSPAPSTPSRPSTLAHPPPIRFPSSPTPSSSRSPHHHHHSHSHLLPPPHCSSLVPSSHPSSNRRCSTPRPKLERPPSTIYTSFPLPPPRTPAEEQERERNGMHWGKWWFSSQRDRDWNRSMEAGDLESGAEGANGKHLSGLGERARLLGVQEEIRPHEVGVGPRNEGLPKVTRSCLIAEIRCYGKYILPPLFLFVFLALSISLYAYGQAMEHEEGSGSGSDGTMNP